MIALHNIEKSFKNFSLAIDTLSIREGEYFVLLGPTGSGKTLLLSILAGLVTPGKGSIQLHGQDITYSVPETRGFGIVYQDSALFPHLSVIQNIGFGLMIKKFPKKEIETRVKNIMNRLGIDYLYGRTTQGLSGGEKQRIALARALIMEPSVLLLDEPFSSLDYLTKEEMIKLIKNIRKEFNPTVLHITHDFEEAMVLANHVGIINKGRLIQTGSVSEIFREPGDPFVANFVGAKNLFSGEIQNSGDTTIFRTEKNLDIFIGKKH